MQLQTHQQNALQKILEEHSIDIPIDELGEKLVNAANVKNTPVFAAYEKLTEVVARHDGALSNLKAELEQNNCGWHEARNDPSWALNSKGKHFDAMRTEIKEAMSNFAASLVESITGEPGQFRAVGTEGYKSDIDLTYLPKNNNGNFSYASSKLIFDAVFAKTFQRLPEDLLDLEVYVQHPGISLHSGEELKTNEGIRRYRQADVQAAFVKIESPEVKKLIEDSINKHASEDVQLGISGMIKDSTLFQKQMSKLRSDVLGSVSPDPTAKKYDAAGLKQGFAEASFRDTLIHTLYANNIQDLQDEIDELEQGIDFGLLSAGGSIQGSVQGGLSRSSLSTGSELEVQRSDGSERGLSRSRLSRLPSSTSDLEVQSSASSISKESKIGLSRLSSSSDSELDVQRSSLSGSSHFKSKPGSSPSTSASDLEVQVSGNSILRGTNGLRFPFRQGSEAPLFQSLFKSTLVSQRTGAPLGRMKSRAHESEQKKLERLDELRVKQAMFGTFTESLTKEGFNSQGALRDIVENRDGQEDTKNAKFISSEILDLELQNLEVPKSIDALLHQKVTPDFYSKITDSKKSSSAGSLLSSAVENFHFYTNHMFKALSSKSESKASAAVVNESKYQLRFVTRTLELYEELQNSKLGGFGDEIKDLKVLLQDAEDLEKMKRQEQLPMTAFLKKLDESPFLAKGIDSKALFKDIPPLKTLRLGDFFQSSSQRQLAPALNPSALTNVKFYKKVIDQLTGPDGPFVKGELRVGKIVLPTLHQRANAATDPASSQQLQQLNTWAMALSGFPASLYALPHLDALEIKKLQNQNVTTILQATNQQGEDLKVKVFEEARKSVLNAGGHDNLANVTTSFDKILNVYGKLVANANMALGLFKKESDFKEENGFSASFAMASGELLERAFR